MTAQPGLKSEAPGGCACSPAYSTGDRTGSITVTEDGTLRTGTPSNLVDGATGLNSSDSVDYAPSTSISSSVWIQFDFGVGNSILITEARWYQNAATNMATWQWYGSDTSMGGSGGTAIGSSFTLGGATPFQTQTQLNGNTTGYRYYELRGVSGTTGTPNPWIQEIEFEQCTC